MTELNDRAAPLPAGSCKATFSDVEREEWGKCQEKKLAQLKRSVARQQAGQLKLAINRGGLQSFEWSEMHTAMESPAAGPARRTNLERDRVRRTST